MLHRACFILCLSVVEIVISHSANVGHRIVRRQFFRSAPTHRVRHSLDVHRLNEEITPGLSAQIFSLRGCVISHPLETITAVYSFAFAPDLPR